MRARRQLRHHRHAPLLVFCFIGLLVACDGEPERENTPPSVPPTPNLTRVELDAYELAWSQAVDDTTPPSALIYQVGVVDTDACIVVTPQYEFVGQTALSTRLDPGYPATPFVGFTLRSLDDDGLSAGYGPCIWGLREPVSLPVAVTARRPRLRPAPAVGPALSCRSDGHDGIWCESQTNLGHFRGIRWQTFPLPQPFETVGWTPVDDYNALVRSERVQLHLSRANGTSAAVISSGSQRFDVDAGAIATGRQRAYLAVRGFAAEFETRHIDMAGPPQPALGLPGPCDRLVQLGYERQLGFALCRVGDEHHLYLGEPDRRQITWRGESIVIDGDRVAGVAGRLQRGLAAVTDSAGARLVRWEDDALAIVSIDGLAGEGRPIVALAGTPDRPFAIAARHFHYRAWDGSAWSDLAEEGDRIVWHDVDFPRESHLVGTRLGVYAVSPERSVRLTDSGAELLSVHPGPSRAVQGRDSRTYLLRGPELREIGSSRDGLAWFTHSWRGPPLLPHDVAVTPAGGIFVSGTTRSPGEPDSAARPIVAKMGEEDTVDRTPPMPITGQFTVPSLAADGRGRLYAFLLGHVAVLDPEIDDWAIIGPVPGRLIALVGLESGALAALETVDGQRLFSCRRELCLEIPVPAAPRRPWGTVMAHGSGFCIGVQSRALWCREGTEDTWIEVVVSEPLSERFGLRPEDHWDIVGAVPLEPNVWLMALETADDGFLVMVDDGPEVTRLLARGIHWGEGDVLLPPDDVSRELGRVVGVEVEGPVEIRYGDSRVSVPGSLYR